jgi:3'(2'), 5'-bisphosphate nucleotidase
LNTSQISYLFEFALTAILKASSGVLKIYEQNQLDVSYKSDKSPITQADKIASDIIHTTLAQTGLPVIDEETLPENYSLRKSWPYFWIVDPLDGTKEFIKRNGEFTVNIALVQSKTPIMGLISIPVKGLLYWGDNINGAYKIKLSDIHNSSYSELLEQGEKLPVKLTSDALKVMISRSHLEDQTLKYIEELKSKYTKVTTIEAGSSLKFCYVAEGKADVYVRFSPTMEWDIAAGHAIVVASGAKITKAPSGKRMLYNKKTLKNTGFIVFRDVR